MKETNKLIAEFMGIVKVVLSPEDESPERWVATINGLPKKSGLISLTQYYDQDSNIDISKKKIFDSKLKYHSSWGWLMPVILKIGTIEVPYRGNPEYYMSFPRTFGMMDDEGNYMFRYNVGKLFTHKELIRSAYDATIDFIKQYNKIPKCKQCEALKHLKEGYCSNCHDHAYA